MSPAVHACRPRMCAVHATTSCCHPPGTCHLPCTCDHLTDVPVPPSTCCHPPSKSCCRAPTTPAIPVHHPHANHACRPRPLSTRRRGHVPCLASASGRVGAWGSEWWGRCKGEQA